MTYDSRVDTHEHIHNVQRFLATAIHKLQLRLLNHDQTKLRSPEVELFDLITPRLKDLVYGSDEYKANLEELGPALDHHYSHNSHHPEFYKEGIKGMNLIDLLEMICDWQAAVLRQPSGDIYKSIEYNQERFGYSDDIKQILTNTVSELTNGHG